MLTLIQTTFELALEQAKPNQSLLIKRVGEYGYYALGTLSNFRRVFLVHDGDYEEEWSPVIESYGSDIKWEYEFYLLPIIVKE